MNPSQSPRISPALALAIETLHGALAREPGARGGSGGWSYFVRIGGELVAHGSPGQRMEPVVHGGKESAR